MYVGIILDVVRDPVRKIIDDQPVLVTVSGAGFWLVIVVVAAFSNVGSLKLLYKRYPRLKTAFSLLLLAIIPAAMISTFSYQRGWLMAAIGGASYIIPIMGIFTGFAFLRKEVDVHRLMKLYVIVNCLMLTSVPMEYFDWDVPGLGGIQFDWIRYREGYTVDLMSGWYRSPDIMGLHAAHVIMFSLLLSVRAKNDSRWLMLPPVLWAAFCVLVSGRRKMIGIPLVFVAAFLALGMFYHIAKVNRLAGLAIISFLFGGCMVIFLWSPDQSAEYTDFASSLFTEGGERANTLIIGSTLGTLQQAGVLGGGLGTATQGRHYANVNTNASAGGWQEDGVSRLFLEFGVPGVILLIISIFLLMRSLAGSLKIMPKTCDEVVLQLGLASIVAGDAASFAISHQQFSGDPVSALLVMLMVGMILRMPVVFASRFALEMSSVRPSNIAETRKDGNWEAMPNIAVPHP